MPADASVREAIARWYEPATLGLLEGTPVNCLLVTLSTGADSEVERQQQRLVQEYARLARERGVAVLGVVYPGSDPLTVAAAAVEARLDGLVLDGEFPGGRRFPEELEAALRLKKSAALVISISETAASVRTSQAALLAVEGVQPTAGMLKDDSARATPTTEPWIESNIWMVRSFRLGPNWRPIWISYRPKGAVPAEYLRCVADAAVAGGRWIVALDDAFREQLFRQEAAALGTWRRIAAYLQFAEDHAEWRSFTPYGNLGIILDTAAEFPEISDEYLNLVARRQVPYRIIQRSELSPESLAGVQAVLAADLDPPTEAERRALRAFAEQGGIVITGPSWGGAPRPQAFERYAEIPLGKGRAVVYKGDPPDAEAVAKDMLDLLDTRVMGLSAFNVQSAITYASTTASGKRVLVQLLNYYNRAVETPLTLRVNGVFKTAHLYIPENEKVALEVRNIEGRTETAIPRLAAWAAVLLE